MPAFAFVFTLLTVLATAALGVAAFLSWPSPYNIFVESWHQAIDVLLHRPRLMLVAVPLLILQLAAPLALAFLPCRNPWLAAAFLVTLQAAVIFALAHVSYRLHRGLIYGEWRPGVTFGRRESRMAFYVVVGWLIVMIFGRLPVPVASSIPAVWTSIIGATTFLLAFVVKVLLAAIGPAASLDDPKPFRRSIASVMREPVAAFSIMAMLQIGVFLLNHAFGLLPSGIPALAILRGLLALSASVFFFILSEFAVVIFLTRVWEDHYESETRCAAHNLSWR